MWVDPKSLGFEIPWGNFEKNEFLPLMPHFSIGDQQKLNDLTRFRWCPLVHTSMTLCIFLSWFWKGRSHERRRAPWRCHFWPRLEPLSPMDDKNLIKCKKKDLGKARTVQNWVSSESFASALWSLCHHIFIELLYKLSFAKNRCILHVLKLIWVKKFQNSISQNSFAQIK